MRLGAAFAMALLLAAAPAWPAMDCSRTRSNAEKMLCSNPRLMQADEQLAYAYRGAIRRGVNPQELIESQRSWIRDARDVCNDTECMLRAYQDRIGDLESR
ncbi:MAG TPA: lysozyme inhibitor LprI family protein [Burkholderiales bacterium]|jgi:uncharacterized protein